MSKAACLLLLCALPGLLHATTTLKGAWARVQPGDTPASILAAAQAGKLTTFDPNRKTAFPPDSDIWIVLWTAENKQSPDRFLNIPAPAFGRLTLYDATGKAVITTGLDDFDAPSVHGTGRVTVFLPQAIKPGQPILLRHHPWSGIGFAMSFHLQGFKEYARSGMYWMSLMSACFGVMLAMVMLALCTAIMLRDRTFLWFASFIACYALLQGILTGYVFYPLHMEFLSGSHLSFAFALVAVMLTCALQFMRTFCTLPQRLPHGDRLLCWLHMAVLLQLLFMCIPYPPIQHFGQTLLMPLVALWTISMLVLAIGCALRGSRTALYFAGCWAPLLVLTFMFSLQASLAWLSGLAWLHDACVWAATFGSLILSIGLADRALAAGRDRDKARVLADHDALTDLLNRRAWSEAADARLSDPEQPWQVLFFLDLDHFKYLNDHFGHAAGDKALVAATEVLRNSLSPTDIVGRYGGEEFIVLSHFISQAHATATAEHVCRSIEALAIPVDEEGTPLTISIGMAIQNHRDHMDSLIRRADLAMYAAKEAGRNRVDWGAGDRRSPASPMRNSPAATRTRQVETDNWPDEGAGSTA